MTDWSKTRDGKPVDRKAHALQLVFGGFVLGGFSVNMFIAPASWLFWPSAALVVVQVIGIYFNFRRVTAPDTKAGPS